MTINLCSLCKSFWETITKDEDELGKFKANIMIYSRLIPQLERELARKYHLVNSSS